MTFPEGSRGLCRAWRGEWETWPAAGVPWEGVRMPTRQAGLATGGLFSVGLTSGIVTRRLSGVCG